MQLCQSPAIFEAATKLFLKEWENEPTISLKQWTSAYQWKSEANVKQNTHDLNSYYTKAADGFSIDSIDCVNEYDHQMDGCTWTSFASFTDCAFGMGKITMKKDENWKDGLVQFFISSLYANISLE